MASTNIKLECYASCSKGKKGFLIERSGRRLYSSITGMVESNTQVASLLSLRDGLTSVKSLLNHDDILTIVLQNRSIVSKICSRDETLYKKCGDVVDEVFDLIDVLDCRYKVIYMENYSAKGFVLKGSPDKPELEGVDSVLDFE